MPVFQQAPWKAFLFDRRLLCEMHLMFAIVIIATKSHKIAFAKTVNFN